MSLSAGYNAFAVDPSHFVAVFKHTDRDRDERVGLRVVGAISNHVGGPVLVLDPKTGLVTSALTAHESLGGSISGKYRFEKVVSAHVWSGVVKP